eukprot:m.89098 g.89098  ORF g.89098 m.89098 type:complete len:398 (+) comp26260_c0_seq6:85-1278(+)
MASQVNTSLVERYKAAVIQNPKRASQVESFALTASYFLPGRFKDSDEISEFVYSVSRLVTFMNDSIIRNKVLAANADHAPNQDKRKSLKLYKVLLSWLTVIDHVQVSVEMTALRIQNRARWKLVALIELLRGIARGILLAKYGSTFLPALPHEPVDRNTITCPDCGIVLVGGVCKECESGNVEDSFAALDRASASLECPECGTSTVINEMVEKSSEISVSTPIVGRRTGRTLHRRKSTLAPIDECETCTTRRTRLATFVRSQRSFQPPLSTALTVPRYISEVVSISRPLVHLMAAYRWGLQSWKAWILALSLELTSVGVVRNEKGMNEKEQSELSRRTMLIFLFALRSPFYERFTKKPLLAFLNGIKRTLPSLSFFIDAIIQYISVWQSLYFYAWST